MRINTNIASMTAQEAATNTTKNISSSLEKLGSGLAINKAADDASGLSIADKLRTQASSLKQGISNANSASALIQIADKAMSEQSNILDIVKTKLIQASTSTTSTEGRESIRKDISKLLEQFDAIASQTNYNGTTLLQKSATDTSKQDDLEFQLGESSAFDVSMVQSKASNTAGLGGGSDKFDFYIDTAHTKVGFGEVGAISTTSISETLNNQTNNIGKGESSVLTQSGVAGLVSTTTDTTITLTAVNVASDGSEAAATVAGVQSTTGGTEGGMDISVTGAIGGLTLDNANATIDVSNQSDAVKQAAKALAEATTDYTYDTDTDIITAGAAATIDFGDIEFSNVQIRDNTDGAIIKLNSVQDAAEDSTYANLTVVNNNDNKLDPSSNQINIELASEGDANALSFGKGQVLADLKNIGEGDLTADVANKFMSTIDEAMTQLNANRSDFGSTQNQLESSIRNMQTTQTNLKAAEAVIRDVDYASESANFNKQNIIAQAGTYAMSQANAMQQNVMRLLQ